ncbi:hypothetical protein BBP40_005826 [Aspergillus hancockii]|nr:hypothetical protein BBP40_005826 [Aspergillus hancockii]
MHFHPLSCMRCRAQKRKCSRETPACSRCHRLRSDCSYPSRRRRHRQEDSTPNFRGSQRDIEPQGLARNGSLTSEVNGLQLLDAYFALFIPSSFVFRPQRVKCCYMDGHISACVRDSIFAMAAHLLRNTAVNPPSHLSTDGAIVAEVEPPGETWAQQASSIVSQQAYQSVSVLDSLQTVFNLISYWCAVGRAQRCRENAKLALSISQRVQMEAASLPLDVSRELEQSCFFVSMISKCIPEDNESVAPRHGIPNSRLPWKPSELDAGRPLRGQMMELVELWLKIRQFARALDVETDPGTQWARLFNLDAETQQMYETFPPALQIFDGRQYHEPDLRESLGLRTLYHMCRFVPHLAMVLFLRTRQPLAADYIQLCAHIAVRHINYVSDTIMKCVASGQGSLPTLPPFVAYCSFISASVYLNYLNRNSEDWSRSSDPTLALLKARLLSNLFLLNQLRRLWAPVRVMWEALQSDFELAGIPITEVVAHSTASQIGCPSFQPSSAERHIESRMIMQFSDIVASVKLFDPAYILVGVFRLFPIAAQPCLASCFSTDDQPIKLVSRYDIRERTSIPESGPSTPHSRYLDDHWGQQTETPTTSNRVPKSDMGPGDIFLLDVLCNLEEDPVTSMGMLQMMWLSGEDLPCT